MAVGVHVYGSWLSGDGTLEGGPSARISILPVSLITVSKFSTGENCG